VNCPYPELSVNGNDNELIQFGPAEHIIRLLAFVPGKVLHEVQPTNELLFSAGAYISHVDKLLQVKLFHHPSILMNAAANCSLIYKGIQPSWFRKLQFNLDDEPCA
jgi:Ser/Thr protein kinase RdoA (MazF antagonist)